MTESEIEAFAIKLCVMWPTKYPDDSSLDFARRVGMYSYHDAMDALDDYKNTKKFAPKVNEIRAMLGGKKQVTKAGEQIDRQPKSFGEMLAKQSKGKHDRFEVLVRYCRWQWAQVSYRINCRGQGVSDAQRAAMIAVAKLEAARFRQECEFGLMSEGVMFDHARALADSIFDEPRTFEQAMYELRTEGPPMAPTFEAEKFTPIFPTFRAVPIAASKHQAMQLAHERQREVANANEAPEEGRPTAS